MKPCDESCYREAVCTVCHGNKARRGRSDFAATCYPTACEGYSNAPIAPHLWPGERPWFTADGTGDYDRRAAQQEERTND